MPLFSFMFSGGFSVVEAEYEVVYYGEVDDPAGGYFTDIGEAIEKVADNGIVYVNRDILIGEYTLEGRKYKQPTIRLDKSIELIGTGEKKPKIKFMSEVDSAFFLNSPEYFKLKGIGAAYLGCDVLEGYSQNIEIKGGSFFNCNPINIYSSQGSTNIIIEDSDFEDTLITVDITGNIGNLQLTNNTFKDKANSPSSVTLSNVSISAQGNIFDNTTLRLDGDQNIEGNIINNRFINTGGRIYITASGKNLRFNHNIITKYKPEEIYYTGNTPIDFTRNWWGSINPPDDERIGGSGKDYIDYSNWSLFEDFSRFKDDPFTVEDLKTAGNELNKAAEDDKIKIFDFDGSGVIELLDLVWLGREIQE